MGDPFRSDSASATSSLAITAFTEIEPDSEIVRISRSGPVEGRGRREESGRGAIAFDHSRSLPGLDHEGVGVALVDLVGLARDASEAACC